MAAQTITNQQSITEASQAIINRAKKQGNERVVFVDTSSNPIQVIDTDSASKSLSKMQKFYKCCGTYTQAASPEWLEEDINWCLRNVKQP